MTTVEDEILLDLAALDKRPLDFVLWAFPWGEKDTELEARSGPDVWQLEVLAHLQELLLAGHCDTHGAIKYAVRSGHGVGKTAFLSWVIWWAVSTMTDTRGRVTANTEKQLRTILWSELAKWHRLFIARQFFKATATAIYSVDPSHEKNWRIDAVAWSEENPEAFAGLHNYGKRIIIVCDEGSGIADKIYEVLDGATTDANTEILWLVASNPTRNYGRFKDTFSSGSGWFTKQVDARDSAFSNKQLIAQWAERWGENSDFFRVRVRGEFPNSSELQLIPVESINAARTRPLVASHFDPLILAVDIARFGNNESVAQFRRAKDARSIPAVRWQGLTVVESAGRIAGLIAQHDPDATFIDEGGVGGGVLDVVRSLGFACVGVNFGASASTRPNGALVGNKRAEMYVALRDWLREGGMIPDNDELSEQLISVEYHFNKKTEIMLLAKEDMRMIGRPSPDWADALAMTFAYPVATRRWRGRPSLQSEYNPFSDAAMAELGTIQ